VHRAERVARAADITALVQQRERCVVREPDDDQFRHAKPLEQADRVAERGRVLVGFDADHRAVLLFDVLHDLALGIVQCSLRP
jgi:hypothetical protein